jgi:hypothetical protein
MGLRSYRVVLSGDYIYAVDETPIRTKAGEEMFKIEGHLPLNRAPLLDGLFLLPMPTFNWMDGTEIPKHYLCLDGEYDSGAYTDERTSGFVISRFIHSYKAPEWVLAASSTASCLIHPDPSE